MPVVILDSEQPCEMPPHVATCIEELGLVRVLDYSIGLVRANGRTLVVLYLRYANSETTKGDIAFSLPVTGAHGLCSDLNSMLTTVPAIRAIIEETLDEPAPSVVPL